MAVTLLCCLLRDTGCTHLQLLLSMGRCALQLTCFSTAEEQAMLTVSASRQQRSHLAPGGGGDALRCTALQLGKLLPCSVVVWHTEVARRSRLWPGPLRARSRRLLCWAMRAPPLVLRALGTGLTVPVLTLTDACGQQKQSAIFGSFAAQG